MNRIRAYLTHLTCQSRAAIGKCHCLLLVLLGVAACTSQSSLLPKTPTTYHSPVPVASVTPIRTARHTSTPTLTITPTSTSAPTPMLPTTTPQPATNVPTSSPTPSDTPQASPTPSSTATPLTPSPYGYLLFIADPGEIYIADANCTQSRLGCRDGWIQLTDASKDRWPPISLTQLTASPDRRYVGFTRLRLNSKGMIERWDVHTLDIEKCRAMPSGCTYDQTSRLLHDPEQQSYDATWSPTDDRIALVLDNHPAFDGIAFISPDSQHQELAFSDDQIASEALLESLAWAPDGRTLALTVSDGEGRWIDTYIYTISLDGPKITQITDSVHQEGKERMDLEPSWSPDGQRIVFVSNHRHEAWSQNDSYLYIMNADGSDIMPLGIQGYSPVWSPEGSKILYVSFGGLYIVGADGGEPMPLTNRNSPGIYKVIWIP